MRLLVSFMAMMAVASSAVTSDKRKKWDGLRVTWGPDLKNPNFFVEYPRTETAAKSEGFRKIGDCDLKAPWRGKRYVKDNDFSVVLLFDIKGHIAGIQSTISKNFSATFPSPKIRPPFVDDEDRWAITAYFTDPSKICTTGRTAKEFSREGTGTNLYIQNSSVPELSTLMPPRMNDLADTLWTRAKCFKTMGIHYYYALRKDLGCDELFPMNLLYNNGELNAFSWLFLANMPSSRFEHAPPNILPLFMDTVPTCLNDYPMLSTMHIYLTDNVALNQC